MEEELKKQMLLVHKTMEIMTNKKTTDLIATMLKNLYDSLIEKGFTDVQAIKIVCNYSHNQGK